MKLLAAVRNFLMMMLLLSAPGLFAEEPAAKPAEVRPALYQSESGKGKTAYVDVARLFNEHPGTKPASEILQKEMEQKMTERQVLAAEVERVSKAGGDADAIKAEWEKVKLYDQQMQTALDARQTEVFAPVFDSIEAAVKEFGVKQGYAAIYVEPREGTEDVTAAILKRLN